MLRASNAHRRARIAQRHGLARQHRYDTIAAATTAMTALHATEASSVHLALLARVKQLTPAEVDHELYEARSLIKTMAMRRTIWVVTRDLLPAVAGSAGRRVAQAQQRLLAKQASEFAATLGAPVDGVHWIDHVAGQVVATLTERGFSHRELRDALPHLNVRFVAGSGKWQAEVSLLARMLVLLAASGQVVRGRNEGHWKMSRPYWSSMRAWLGEPLVPEESVVGYREVVRHLLWTFGPVTETDLVWWLGSTKAAARQALKDLAAETVELEDHATGFVLPDDTADLQAPPDTEPWVALAPTLDPTTMGWKERDWYLPREHVPFLFDTAGNGGTTVWVDGRIVGCWVQDDDGRVQLILKEDVDRSWLRLLDDEVDRLNDFLDGVNITNVFASPQVRGVRLG